MSCSSPFVLQSTTSDQVLENAYKIQKLLKNKRSKVSFLLHDSIILDMSFEESGIVKDAINIFQETRWGKFKTSCKIGKNFGEMRKIKI